ncbi:MAG: GNAT family N-acetyltransferase [Pseudomonadota bacterium]
MSERESLGGAARPTLRLATAADWAAIENLAEAAFGAASERALLVALREAGALLFTVVAERSPGALIAFAAFSEAGLLRDAGPAVEAMAVAGLAVAAAERGRGLGRDVLRVGVAQCRKRGAGLVLVHTQHRVFERAGFSARAADRLETRWSAGTVMALPLSDDIGPLIGTATWPAPFHERPSFKESV